MKGLPALFRKIARQHILVIGDVMLDHYIWGDATRISPEAPVPVVDIARDTWTAGGAANVALNLAALGARCTVAGFIGPDEAGARLTQILQEKGITPLSTPGTGATILKTRVLVQHQQLCRLDRESPQGHYAISGAQATALLGDAIRQADAIILSDYAKGILSDELVARVDIPFDATDASGLTDTIGSTPHNRLGGMGSASGAALAAFLVGMLRVMSVAYLDSSFRDAFVFALLIAVLLVRPSGLLGRGRAVRA